MKKSNTLAANVTIKQLQKGVWLNTRGMFMKESNILVVNVANNLHIREVFLNTRSLYIINNKIQTHVKTIFG